MTQVRLGPAPARHPYGINERQRYIYRMQRRRNAPQVAWLRGCFVHSLMAAAPTHPVTVMQFLKVSINLALASAPRVVIAFYWGRITHRCRRRGPSARFHAPSPPLTLSLSTSDVQTVVGKLPV